METPKTLTERVEKGSKTMTFEEYTRMMYYGNPQDAEREAALRREYETARRVMELAGDGMDAETFCSHFAAIGGNPLFQALFIRADRLDIDARGKRLRMKKAAHDLIDLADDVRDSEDPDSEDMADEAERIASTLLSRRECITWKLDHGYGLSELDNIYINNNLL